MKLNTLIPLLIAAGVAIVVIAAPQPRGTLKTYYQTGDHPTEAQFAETIDTFSNDLTSGWKLAIDTAVGATSLTTDRTVTPLVVGSFVFIDPFSVNGECRKLTTCTGTTLGFAALVNTHSAEAHIIHVRSDTVPLSYYGAVGNASANDSVAVQAAFDDQNRRGAQMGIDGGGSTYIVHSPILIAQSGRFSNGEFKASVSFTPAEVDNALVMNQNGVILAPHQISAVTSTDVFTSTIDLEDHLPTDNTRVMVKNKTGLSNIVAGKIYYTRDRTDFFHFKLSATPGGAALDVGSDGTCTFYTSVQSAGRVYLDNVTIDGSTTEDSVSPGVDGVVGTINGMVMGLQQPASFNKLRIENCNGTGAIIGGQDGLFQNTMIIRCENGLTIDNGSYFKFNGFNVEQTHIGVQFSIGTGNSFWGVHNEGNNGAGYSTASTIYFQIGVLGSQQVLIDGWHASFNTGGQTMFKNLAAPTLSSYTIRGLDCPATPTAPAVVMVNDAARNITLDNWSANSVASGRKFMDQLIVPIEQTSPVFWDEGRFQILGADGAGHVSRFIKMGSNSAFMPNMILQPRDDQVGNLIDFNNKTGTLAAFISPNGAVSSLYERFGSGTPEGAVSAPVGAVYHRTNGGAGTSFYVKESGTGNTGWVGK